MTADARQFVLRQRVGHLATATASGMPAVVPVCYALGVASLYIGIDEKPKRADVYNLRRLANLRENPRASVCVDHYEDDWRRLGFVLLHGPCDVLEDGDEHADSRARLRERYPQLDSMQVERLPVIALRIERVTTWGAIGATAQRSSS